MKMLLKAAGLILLVLFLVLSPPALDKKLIPDEWKQPPRPTVIVVWHMDTFEGGKGSRKTFLESAAASFEAKHDGVFISVISHTPSSAEESLGQGNTPDLISFGIGADGVAERAKPLKTHKNDPFFNSVTVGGNTLAYPWAYGIYIKFERPSPSAPDKEGGQKTKKAVVGVPANNHTPYLVASLGEKAAAAATPLEAYSGFADGKYDVLYGTQRDLVRLEKRGVEFTATPFGEFTDLVQYISVTSADPARTAAAALFAEYLISDEVQSRLGDLALLSPTGAATSQDGLMKNFASFAPARVLNPFLDKEKRAELKRGPENDFLEKFRNYLAE